MSLDFFAAKQKRKDEFDAACLAMESAMANMHLNVAAPANISRGSDDETVDVLEKSGPQTPLLNSQPLSYQIAQTILNEVKKLQKENPLNTEFLRGVLSATTAYIQHPNDSKMLGKYNQMIEKVADKYGRYSKLTVGLFALPTAVFVGGTIGIIIACTSFPPLWPIIATCSIVALLGLTLASTAPVNKTAKIANAWDGLKTTFGR